MAETFVYPCTGCMTAGRHADNCATQHMGEVWTQMQVLIGRVQVLEGIVTGAGIVVPPLQRKVNIDLAAVEEWISKGKP